MDAGSPPSRKYQPACFTVAKISRRGADSVGDCAGGKRYRGHDHEDRCPTRYRGYFAAGSDSIYFRRQRRNSCAQARIRGSGSDDSHVAGFGSGNDAAAQARRLASEPRSYSQERRWPDRFFSYGGRLKLIEWCLLLNSKWKAIICSSDAAEGPYSNCSNCKWKARSVLWLPILCAATGLRLARGSAPETR